MSFNKVELDVVRHLEAIGILNDANKSIHTLADIIKNNASMFENAVLDRSKAQLKEATGLLVYHAIAASVILDEPLVEILSKTVQRITAKPES